MALTTVVIDTHQIINVRNNVKILHFTLPSIIKDGTYKTSRLLRNKIVSFGKHLTVNLYDGGKINFVNNILDDVTEVDERNFIYCVHLNF